MGLGIPMTGLFQKGNWKFDIVWNKGVSAKELIFPLQTKYISTISLSFSKTLTKPTQTFSII